MQRCGQCEGIELEFNAKLAARELATYRARGPAGTTRLLIDLLREHGAAGCTLLDVGGGIGAIQHELAQAGAAQITSVEASSAYLEAQRCEASRRGYADRVTYHRSDFVIVAEQLPRADIVTLDRVICCCDDMRELVARSVAHARRLYAAVYPRQTWLNAIGIAFANSLMRLRRSSFRSYLHPTAEIESIITAGGFVGRNVRETIVWRIAVFSRWSGRGAPD